MSLQPAYFDDLYDASSDPWSLASRWYEQRKYAITMASLSRPRYGRAFEPGCSVGVLTAQLATRCESLLATDVAAAAVDTARARVAASPGVEVALMQVPEQWPRGRFDLIVLSEVAYYLSHGALDVLVANSVESLDPAGELCLVHWRHPVSDYPLRGDAVHERFRAEPALRSLAHYQDSDFRLDVFASADGASVAEREGLV
jgi:predicted TPR repeat methyltransferase